jgi:hypothetical protein
MKKSNQQKLVSGIGLALAGMTALTPLQSMAINTQASVKVKNAITFAETAPLNFGTVRANYNVAQAANASASAARVTLPADDAATMTATAGTNGFSMNSLVRGSSAKYTVSGAAPFTAVNILITDAASGTAGANVALTTANTAAPGFVIVGSSWTARDLVLNSTFDIGDANGLGQITTDGTGAASFSVGAQLSTDLDNTKGQNYDQNNEVEYTGQFAITVSY